MNIFASIGIASVITMISFTIAIIIAVSVAISFFIKMRKRTKEREYHP